VNRARAAVRSAARAVVGPLPVPAADLLRRPRGGPPGLLRRAALRALREGGIPRGVTTFRLLDDPHLSFVAADSLVLAQLYWYGTRGWEPELLPWWRALCRRSGSVLELGANVGWFTVQAARAAPGVRHVAVEPHPVSLRICRANLALNGIGTVELLGAAAVADAAGTARLLVPADQLATPTVAFLPSGTELPRAMARDVTTVLDVPAVDVRELLAGADLVKLDVEGQEHALLAAGLDVLRERRPTVVVEVLPGTPRLRALLAGLCRADGYRCYAPTPDRLVELPPERLATVRLREEFGGQDVILCASDPPPPDPGPATVPRMSTADRVQDDVAQVLTAEDRRYAALLGPDLPTLERLFHDRLSYAHSSGVRDTREEYLAKVRSGYYVYLRVEHPVERVEVVGDTALVVGRMTADITVDGTPKTIDNLALAVWTRAGGDWRLLAYAPTSLPA
jgi:FkbM family methyltransferase